MSKKSIFSIFVAIALLATCYASSISDNLCNDFSADANYGTHMVLQRDCPIRISGYGEPGKKIHVNIGDIQQGTFTVGNDGRWTAIFEAMPAGGPYQLTISGAENAPKIIFNDVMIGEVWICSGQSNMEMPIYSVDSYWRDQNYQELLDQADQFPMIRIFNESPQKEVSPEAEQLQPKAKWTLATAETLPQFSSVAYQFGRQLSQDLPGIAIGLINVSWSGTRIEPWISKKSFEAAGRTNELEILKTTLLNNDNLDAERARLLAEFETSQKAWNEKMSNFNEQEALAAADWRCPETDDSQWTVLSRGDNAFPESAEGIGWFRKTIHIPEAWVGQDLQLNLGIIDDCDWTYVNGELVGQTLTDVNQYWTVQRSYIVPGHIVKSTELTIAIRMADLYAEGGMQNQGEDMNIRLVENPNQFIDLGHDWKFRVESTFNVADLGGQPKLEFPQSPAETPHIPTTLFNGLIAPWTKYPVQGAIWYQGCGNAAESEQYFHLQQLLVNDWRRAWNNPNFAFIICQLSGYLSDNPDGIKPQDSWKQVPPGSGGFAPIRDVQWRSIRAMTNTGMAVTYDYGDQFDIHPHNKGPVGYRLAKEAERICYGYQGISSGPEFKNAEFKNGQVVIHFSNVGGGLVAKGNDNGQIGACAIAGADGKFVAANAVIRDNTLIISSPEIPEPAEVRYGWVSYSEDINLYNAEGFPAIPFRAIR